MPTTVTPRIYTGAFPAITVNALKYVLYAASDPSAEVTSQTFAAPHPARTVSFPGLDRVNYKFKLLEMSGGLPINTLADFDFNPDNTDFEYRVPEILEVGVTVGLVDGATTFTFDGSGGKADWRTWIPIMQPPGFGPLLEGYDYTWNSVTGLFTLINGTTFASGVRYLVEFEPVTVTGATGIPGGSLFTAVLKITSNTVLTAADMGKKILIAPATPYIVITMPDIATVVRNRVTFFETVPQGAGTRFCVKIIAAGTTQWTLDPAGRTSMYMIPGEKFEAYKYNLAAGVDAWRTQNEVGGFISVGRNFASDRVTEIGAQLMDGSTGDVEKDARIWNDFILQLDGSQVVSYADWGSTVANQTKWSLQNGDTPAKFHFPDRRNLHERNTAALPAIAGVYDADAVGPHQHLTPSAGGDNAGAGLIGYGKSLISQLTAYFNVARMGYRDLVSNPTGATGVLTGATETKVKSYSINRFVQL